MACSVTSASGAVVTELASWVQSTDMMTLKTQLSWTTNRQFSVSRLATFMLSF